MTAAATMTATAIIVASGAAAAGMCLCASVPLGAALTRRAFFCPLLGLCLANRSREDYDRRARRSEKNRDRISVLVRNLPLDMR